jgi:hypothetical protein
MGGSFGAKRMGEIRCRAGSEQGLASAKGVASVEATEIQHGNEVSPGQIST